MQEEVGRREGARATDEAEMRLLLLHPHTSWRGLHSLR